MENKIKLVIVIVLFYFGRGFAQIVVSNPTMDAQMINQTSLIKLSAMDRFKQLGESLAIVKEQLDNLKKFKAKTDSIYQIAKSNYKMYRKIANYDKDVMRDLAALFEANTKISLNPHDYIGYEILYNPGVAEALGYPVSELSKLNKNYVISQEARILSSKLLDPL